PAEDQLSAAEQEGAAMVVVGSRGAGRAGPGILGSTSNRLARSCPVPVVIVPAPHPDGAEATQPG
ncbi:MAG: universal stress protein, partial [Acidimicrobiales bacterium]